MTLYSSKIKKVIFCIFFISLLFILLMLCSVNLKSVRSTLDIFIYSVFPSLFPFILFTEVLLKTDAINSLSKYLAFIPKMFKLSENCLMPIIIGFLCGFPSGAKAIENYYASGKITLKEAKILNLFIHNCSPLFILSTVSLAILGNIRIGILLLISHILSSIIIGLIFSHTNIIHENSLVLNRSHEKNAKKPKIMLTSFDILKTSIQNSFITLGNILGFMIIFNMAADIICYYVTSFTSNVYIISISTCMFEVTRGIKSLSNIPNIIVALCLISFNLGFSGFSIIFQIKSSFNKLNVKLTDIIKIKLLHGIFSSIITYILLRYTNIAIIDTLSVFSSIDTLSSDSIHNVYNIYFYFSIFTIFVVSTYLLISYFRPKKIKVHNIWN